MARPSDALEHSFCCIEVIEHSVRAHESYDHAARLKRVHLPT
jgi:hypothetical protein